MINGSDSWPLGSYRDLQVFLKFGFGGSEALYPWEALEMALQILAKNANSSISPDSFVSPSAIIEGPVIIEPGAKIMEGAKLIGPSYVGKNSIVGNSSLVRESFIGDNCVIGYTVDIARSCIGKSCWLSRSHIADSILGDSVNMGGGSVITSLRLDNNPILVQASDKKINTGRIKLGAMVGNNTQIGANVAIMPGVMIGANCIIGPGVLVEKNVSDNSFCKLLQNLEIRENQVVYQNAVHKELRGYLGK